ncbi:MAG: hypothetical protein V1873_03420 [Verrucomicrobiota bacterium]
MPRPSIFTDRELAFLRELVKNKVPFMIVGLSAAALQGAPVVTQDVDLWFRSLAHPGLKKALRKVEGAYVPPSVQNPPMFAGDAVDLFDIVMNMHGLRSFDWEYQRALRVPLGRFAVKVLPLERIIASKKAANRDKDRLTLPVLRDALAAIRGR